MKNLKRGEVNTCSMFNYDFRCQFYSLNCYSSLESKQLFFISIKNAVQNLNDKEKLILYLDGFEEFGQNREDILTYIGLKNHQELLSSIKIIVSCRNQEIDGNDQRKIFDIANTSEFLQKAYIQPLKLQQVFDFIPNFMQTIAIAQDRKECGKIELFKTSKQYEEAINQFASLKNLVQEPLMTRIIVAVLPEIFKKYQSNQEYTTFEMLREFVDKWIYYELQTLKKNEMNILQENYLQFGSIPFKFGIDEAHRFATAQCMLLVQYIVQNFKMIINHFTQKDIIAISIKQNLEMNFIQLLTSILPVIILDDDTFQFIHSSLIDEYFFKVRLHNEEPIKCQQQEEQLIVIEQLYERKDKNSRVNLMAHLYNIAIPFCVQKYFSNVEEYRTEKKIYENIPLIFSSEIAKYGILMKKAIDVKQELYFDYCSCTLSQLAAYYKGKNELLPNKLIIQCFKVVSNLIFILFEKGYYCTDISLESVAFEYDEQRSQSVNKDIYNIKLVGFGGLSDKLTVTQHYTPLYFISQLTQQRKLSLIHI
eukprot:TRINITY_DN7810_c0_g1_i1.p1 TRINITY_DN7810_c0_g1~~TRINITY_DN7810_c0_g1_i1.p1  ORF type:complete len:535 (-),score=67.14 TRINITY_DN7810_c0_g1_i1:105-1709(-)